MTIFVFEKKTGKLTRIVSAENMPRCITEIKLELDSPEYGVSEKPPYQGESYSKEEMR